MSEHIFGGVPRALAVDAWWMSADAEFDAPDAQHKMRQVWASRKRRRILLLVVLIALADALFFQQAVGISIAVFVIALFAANVFETHTRNRKAADNVFLNAIFGNFLSMNNTPNHYHQYSSLGGTANLIESIGFYNLSTN